LPDAVVVGSGSNDVMVYRTIGIQNGAPVFAPGSQTYFVGTDPVNVTIRDLNGDGIPDLVVPNQGSNDVSILFGAYDSSGNWFATPGPRLKSGGFGPIAVNVLPDAHSPGGNDLEVINGQDGTVAVLPGRGAGFFDERQPRMLMLGTPVINSPAIVGGMEVLPAQDGGLIAFDTASLTGLRPVLGPVGVQAVTALADGRVFVAGRGGTVEELQLDAVGRFDVAAILVPETGIPSQPSALAILEEESGLEALVTAAGSDTLFVFDFVSNSPPSFPPLPPPNPAEPGPSTLPATPLVVVVVPVTGGLPEEAVAQAQQEQAENAGTTFTLVGAPLAGLAAFPASGGSEVMQEEDEGAVAASEGPDPLDALRKLPLSSPGEEEAPPPRTDRPSSLSDALSGPTIADPVLVNLRPPDAGTDPVWEDLSWLRTPPPPSANDAAPYQPQVEPAVLPAQSPEQSAPRSRMADGEQAPNRLEQAAEIQAGMKEPAGLERSAQSPTPPGWDVRIIAVARHAVGLLGAFAVPCWRGTVHREGGWPSRFARVLFSFRRGK
jgi:hypothetical protein